jgi:hypothetical protein
MKNLITKDEFMDAVGNFMIAKLSFPPREEDLQDTIDFWFPFFHAYSKETINKAVIEICSSEEERFPSLPRFRKVAKKYDTIEKTRESEQKQIEASRQIAHDPDQGFDAEKVHSAFKKFFPDIKDGKWKTTNKDLYDV